jgi:hypothetical protein
MVEKGIIIDDQAGSIRAVTHYGIDDADISAILEAAAECSRSCMAS